MDDVTKSDIWCVMLESAKASNLSPCVLANELITAYHVVFEDNNKETGNTGHESQQSAEPVESDRTPSALRPVEIRASLS